MRKLAKLKGCYRGVFSGARWCGGVFQVLIPGPDKLRECGTHDWRTEYALYTRWTREGREDYGSFGEIEVDRLVITVGGGRV